MKPNRYDRLGPGWFAPGCPNAAEEPLDIGFVITDGKITKNLAAYCIVIERLSGSSYVANLV